MPEGRGIRTVKRVVACGQKCILVDSIQGSRMLIPRKVPRDDYLHPFGMIFYGCWEPDETSFARSVISKGMHVIDVGAMFGYYTLLFSRLVGEDGCVYSIEPNKRMIDLVKESASINRMRNIYWFNYAVGEKEWAKIPFNHHECIITNKDRNPMVTLTTLDSIIPQGSAGKIGFVKIDTDGYDVNVLCGMREILRFNPAVIIMMEYMPELWRKVGMSFHDFMEFIKDQDLSCKVIGSRGTLLDPPDGFFNYHTTLEDEEKTASEVLATGEYKTLVLMRR